MAASVGGYCPDPWAPGVLARHPGVPGNPADSGDEEWGQGRPPVAHGSAAAGGAGPAVLERSSGWLAAKGCLWPLRHRRDHRRRLAQRGGPRWLRGTRTAQEHLGSVAPVGTAIGSLGCLHEGQMGARVCMGGQGQTLPGSRKAAAPAIPLTWRWGQKPLGERQRQP